MPSPSPPSTIQFPNLPFLCRNTLPEYLFIFNIFAFACDNPSSFPKSLDLVLVAPPVMPLFLDARNLSTTTTLHS